MNSSVSGPYLSGNSFVYTDSGIKKVNELRSNMKIWTSQGWVSQKVKKVLTPMVCITFSDGSELTCGKETAVKFNKINPIKINSPLSPERSEQVGKIYGKLFKFKKNINNYNYDIDAFLSGWQEAQRGHIFGNLKTLQELQIMSRFTQHFDIVLNSVYELVKSDGKQYVVNVKKTKNKKCYLIKTEKGCVIPVNTVCVQA